MEIKAQLRHLRISPRKVRALAKPLRGLSLREAQTQLDYFHRGASEPLRKLIASAAANAQNNFHLDKSSLYISKITVDSGPSRKRMRARAQGRAAQILKRTSHVTVLLGSSQAVEKSKVVGFGQRPAEIIFEKEKEEEKPTREREEKAVASERQGAPRRLPRKISKPQRALPGTFRRMFRRKAI